MHCLRNCSEIRFFSIFDRSKVEIQSSGKKRRKKVQLEKQAHKINTQGLKQIISFFQKKWVKKRKKKILMLFRYLRISNERPIILTYLITIWKKFIDNFK